MSPTMPNSPIRLSLSRHGVSASGRDSPLHRVPNDANKKNAMSPRVRKTRCPKSPPSEARARRYPAGRMRALLRRQYAEDEGREPE